MRPRIDNVYDGETDLEKRRQEAKEKNGYELASRAGRKQRLSSKDRQRAVGEVMLLLLDRGGVGATLTARC